MAIRLRKFLVLLHLLLLQEMMAMLGEAALCEAPSRLFRGACFSNRNCANICEKEGFLNGRCKILKCKCTKDCNGGGGDSGGGAGGSGSPGEGPPDSGGSPPGEGPPDGSDGPPTEGPPDSSDGPPKTPVEGPPCDHGPPSV